MYAIFQHGGKQYRVSVGSIVRLEKLNGDIGRVFTFNQVIMVVNFNNLQIGDPFLASSNVVGEIIQHGRSSKVRIIKFRRRKHFRKCQGHRQWFSDVKINSIVVF